MSVQLPDCGKWRGRFHLTAEQKRELVELIAAKGPGAIDEYLAAKAQEDRHIAAKVHALRAELLARAEALRRALEEQFHGRKQRLEAELQAREAELHGQREAAARRLDDFRLTRDVRLAEVLQRSDLVQLALSAPLPEPGPWKRFLAALRRLWHALLRALGLRKAPRRKPLLAAFPAARGLGLDLGRLEAALGTDAMRQRVRSRLQALPPRERLRQLWQRLLGREDYESLAAKLMEEELQRQLRERERELGEEERAMAERLAQLAEQEARAREREREELERLEQERRDALRKLREQAEREPLKRVADEVREELAITGYLKEGPSGPSITQRLVDRFSELVFEAEMKALPSAHRAAYGSYVEGEGVFRKEPLLSVDELSHMDLVGSALQAKLRHPRQRHIYEDDVLVYREMRSSQTHVVLVFDTSGSMEENQRLDAAKRAALALVQAVKREHKGNRVDLVLMETSVRRADVLEAWLAKPRGFTNTGGAIALARALLERSRADRKLLYLITDGLPEAMTLPNGEDIASYPDRCLAYALEEVRKLKAMPGLGFAILLLEPEDEQYVKAAEAIAAEVQGKVMPTDPRELARRVLVDFGLQRKPMEAAPAR
jgi:Mg-chelatase subunit ChlD